eukprot:scaffold159796_cov19-Tisochrysis_lutea.AAC.1
MPATPPLFHEFKACFAPGVQQPMAATPLVTNSGDQPVTGLSSFRLLDPLLYRKQAPTVRGRAATSKKYDFPVAHLSWGPCSGLLPPLLRDGQAGAQQKARQTTGLLTCTAYSSRMCRATYACNIRPPVDPNHLVMLSPDLLHACTPQAKGPMYAMLATLGHSSAAADTSTAAMFAKEGGWCTSLQ